MTDYELIECRTQSDFRQWLARHGSSKAGVWLRLYKKASGIESITYPQALDEALCHGWIDGQRKSYDEVSYVQKYTPRRVRSIWSKRNIEHVARLIEAGLMTDAGLKEVERAQRDGRWAAAYDSFVDMKVPADFLVELHKNPKAEVFFNTLSKSNVYTIAWRLQTAKTDATRRRRTEKLIAMLSDEKRP